jgi:hypothetical protein
MTTKMRNKLRLKFKFIVELKNWNAENITKEEYKFLLSNFRNQMVSPNDNFCFSNVYMKAKFNPELI